MEGKNLTEPELQTGLHSVLDSNIEDFEKAVFLEALRLKRETLEENKACLRFLQSRIQRTPLQTPGLIQISDPFDGYNRHPHLSLFVSVILGSIGLPTLIHGIKEVSPKRGITPHKLLVNAKKRPIITIKETEEQLMTPHIGWAYLDQSSYLPELAELVPLRQAMLKRPLLSTIEKFCCPFSTPNTLLVTGYTHPPYKKMMTSLFLETLPTQSMLLLRGIEGSTHLPLDRRAPYMFCTASDTKEDFCRPSQLNFPETDTIQDTEITEKQSLTQGIQALSGKESPLQSSLIYTASMIAHFHTQKPLTDLRKIISETILSGKALSHWEKGQC